MSPTPTPPGRVVATDIVTSTIQPDGRGIHIRLRYDPTSDPYIVTATFTEVPYPEGPPVDWVIGRDLLRDGLSTRAGEIGGDVYVFPMAGGAGDAALVLSPPEGAVVIRLPGRWLRRFLDAAYRLVPVGEEPLWLDLDEELRQLVAGDG